MDNYLDFTWSPTNFPQAGMASFVNQLHADNQKYVVIVDPGISIDTTYPPYQQGVASNVFVRDAAGNYFVGDVWPGLTNYPDWFAPNTSSWWATQIQGFLAGVPVDGLWTDMNEASNFCNGECPSGAGQRAITSESGRALAAKTVMQALQAARARRPGPRQSPAGFDPQDPPYAINNFGDHLPLNTHAMDLDAVHYGGLLEYNTHNLYGFGEAIATDAALEKIRQQRSLVISRSTFPGAGKYAGHWLGDNDSSFGDLYYSIAGILNYQVLSSCFATTTSNKCLALWSASCWC
jgi:alpha-glucosidase (family GH31 glycosyl hydrolase)